MERLICLAALVIGYGFGLAQIAHIYSKAKNVNIREKGSGNAGTTNMFRVMGIKAGVITLIGDCGKCVAAVFFTRFIFLTWLKFDIDPMALLLYTGLGCALGHDFPFYFHFKGGKGMATTAALFCCIGCWQDIVIGVIVFFGLVAVTRFVSLGSMSTVTVFTVFFIIFAQNGIILISPLWKADCYVIIIILALLLIFQHRKNISRLLKGCETKFYFRSSRQIKLDEAQHAEEQAEAKIEKLQNKAETKSEKLQNKAETKTEKLQSKAEAKSEKLQSKTEVKSEKVQDKKEKKLKKVQSRIDKKLEKTQEKKEKAQTRINDK